jgi:hypothetical protein
MRDEGVIRAWGIGSAVQELFPWAYSRRRRDRHCVCLDQTLLLEFGPETRRDLGLQRIPVFLNCCALRAPTTNATATSAADEN